MIYVDFKKKIDVGLIIFYINLYFDNVSFLQPVILIKKYKITYIVIIYNYKMRDFICQNQEV